MEYSDTFSRPLVTSAQSINGTEMYPAAGVLINYNDDDFSQGFGQIMPLKAPRKDEMLQP